MLSYSEDQIREKAVELGLIGEGESLPAAQRSRAVAALVHVERDAKRSKDKRPEVADSIVIEPSGLILINDQVLPWMVARQPIDVVCNPNGPDTVRLTLLAEHAVIVPPFDEETESENRA